MNAAIQVEKEQIVLSRAPQATANQGFRDFTITFFVDSVQPASLPSFPYGVTGSAAGRIQMHAYVPARSAVDAQYLLTDYFPDAYVECIEHGRTEPPVPRLHGVDAPAIRLGLFRRLFSFFG